MAESPSLERTKPQSNPTPFVARGSLGGVIVGLIVFVGSAISYKLTLGYIPYVHIFIIQGLPLAVIAGAVMGGFIGLVIWTLSVVRGQTFAVAGRAIIGFITASVVLALYGYFHTETPGLYREPLSRSRQAVYWLMHGAVIGVLPGLMSRQASQPSKVDGRKSKDVPR